MEDFSGFIHEEIFLIDQGKKTVVSSNAISDSSTPSDQQNDQPILNYKIGIVAPGANTEDKELLSKILSAITIEPASAYFSEAVSSKIGTWIVFSGSLDSIREGLEYFTINNLDGAVVITSRSLEQLRNSVEDKSKLWMLLKEHFKA